jgi:hypothetical protein
VPLNRILFSTRKGRFAALPGACVLVLTVGSLLAEVATAGDWVTFTDETSTRISADPVVGVDDVREKDITSGDVDKDGDTDLIVVRKIPFTNAGGFRNVLFMNENGVMTDLTATFAPDFLDATDDREVELADVDGDTWLDIITAGTFDEQPRILMNLGEDAGVWQGFEYEPLRLPVLTSPTGNGPKFCGLGVGDVTGNGRPDLYFTDYENDMEDKLLINNGSGFFTDETATRLDTMMVDSTFGTDADIADVNGDGWNDIIRSNSSGSGTGGLAHRGAAREGEVPEGSAPAPAVLIAYNDGLANPGNFSFMDTVNTDAPYMVAPADFTQDGRLDIFVVDDGQDRYLVNNGNDGQGHAQFATSTINNSPNTSFFGGNTRVADIDDDGILDILIADVDTDIPGCDRQLVALQGQGTPPNITYTDPLGGASRPWTVAGTFDVEVLDINGDTALDLWIGHCAGTKIFMGFSPEIFEDGFESGDTSAWSNTVP